MSPVPPRSESGRVAGTSCVRSCSRRSESRNGRSRKIARSSPDGQNRPSTARRRERWEPVEQARWIPRSGKERTKSGLPYQNPFAGWPPRRDTSPEVAVRRLGRRLGKHLVHHGVASTDGGNRRLFGAIGRIAAFSSTLIIAVKPPRRPLAPFSRLNRPQTRVGSSKRLRAPASAFDTGDGRAGSDRWLAAWTPIDRPGSAVACPWAGSRCGHRHRPATRPA